MFDDDTLTLERAEADDAEAIGDLVLAAYEEYVADMGRWPMVAKTDVPAAIRDDLVWVVREAGRVIAALQMIERGDHMFLDNVAVAPDHQKRGIGVALVDFAEAETRRRGYGEIRLVTNETMTGNITAYVRRGYAETRREPVRGTDAVHMCKVFTD